MEKRRGESEGSMRIQRNGDAYIRRESQATIPPVQVGVNPHHCHYAHDRGERAVVCTLCGDR